MPYYFQFIAHGGNPPTRCTWGQEHQYGAPTLYNGIHVPTMDTRWSTGCPLGMTEPGIISEGKRSNDGKTIYWYSGKNANYQYN